MRPRNYAHERWPEYSDIIRCLKNRVANRYYKIHTDGSGHKVVIKLTKAQAFAYDAIMEHRDGNIIEPRYLKKVNFKSIEALILKHKLFTVIKGNLVVL